MLTEPRQAVASEVFVHGIALNSLMPFKSVPTPSMLDVAPHLDAYVTAESFAQAALRLLTCRPIDVGGMALYGEDVLHPELGTRGWLADSM